MKNFSKKLIIGALFLATNLVGFSKDEYQQEKEPTLVEKITYGLETLIKDAQENKSGKWRRDWITSRVQEYNLSNGGRYFSVLIKEGKFSELNYSGLEPNTANLVEMWDDSKDGIGYNKPEANGCNKYDVRTENPVFKITPESTKKDLDKANETEWKIIQWALGRIK